MATFKPHPLKQSTLVLVIVFAILLTMLIPQFFAGEGDIREEQFTTNDGQTYNCIVYSESNGSGGLDCFSEEEKKAEQNLSAQD